MQEELDDAGSVVVQVTFQIDDRSIPATPQSLVVRRYIGQSFVLKDLGMHAGDQDLLVIGPVENADPAAFRKVAAGAPEKVVLQFGVARMLEAEHLAALRVDSRHDVLDR